VLPVLLATVLGIVDIARYLIVLQTLSVVVAEGGRVSQIYGLASGGIQQSNWTALPSITPLLDPAKLTVATTVQTGIEGYPYQFGGAVAAFQITASYPYEASSPWLGFLNGTISQRATLFN